MEEFETRTIATFGDGIQFWVRYVDDAFCIVKKDRVSSLQDIHVEQEENNNFYILKLQNVVIEH